MSGSRSSSAGPWPEDTRAILGFPRHVLLASAAAFSRILQGSVAPWSISSASRRRHAVTSPASTIGKLDPLHFPLRVGGGACCARGLWFVLLAIALPAKPTFDFRSARPAGLFSIGMRATDRGAGRACLLHGADRFAAAA